MRRSADPLAAEDERWVGPPGSALRARSKRGIADLPVGAVKGPSIRLASIARGRWRASPRACRSAREAAGTRSRAACSRSCQPAPSPSSTRPPLISSTVATTFAQVAGQAEGDRADQGPEADPRRLTGEAGERRPCVGRGLVARAPGTSRSGQSGSTPEGRRGFGGPGEGQDLGVGEPLLGLRMRA